MKSCRHRGRPPNCRPQRRSALQAASPLSPPASNPRLTCPWPPAGSPPALCTREAAGPGSRAFPTAGPGANELPAQPAPPEQSQPPPRGAEVGSRGGSSPRPTCRPGHSCARSPRALSPCPAGGPFAPALSARRGDKWLYLCTSQSPEQVTPHFLKSLRIKYIYVSLLLYLSSLGGTASRGQGRVESAGSGLRAGLQTE